MTAFFERCAHGNSHWCAYCGLRALRADGTEIHPARSPLDKLAGVAANYAGHVNANQARQLYDFPDLANANQANATTQQQPGIGKPTTFETQAEAIAWVDAQVRP